MHHDMPRQQVNKAKIVSGCLGGSVSILHYITLLDIMGPTTAATCLITLALTV